LYFYPKDNTPGCTAQACNLNENLDALKAKGFQVIGVSIDSNASHTKFKAKFNLQFPLLSDPEHEVAEAFGVWVEKSMYGKQYMGVARTTFIIDEKGIITDIIEKVDTKNHSSQIH
jgi:peroxiredoxin Q/BCP